MRRTHYKATRPDGTDFRTGTIKYEVGATVTHPSAKRVKGDPSTYLSVSTVPTDCTGFSWPCRLFEVEGVGRPLTATDLPNKRCFSSVRVIEERPAHEVFGPQGEQVVAVIDRADRLTAGEAKRLGAAWGAAWGAARDAAWDAARDAALGAAARGAAAWGAAWDAARDAAWDATLAYLVRDLITVEQFDQLTGPWLSVTGEAT